jgi:uncharacterized DUF497 family protein
VPLAYIDLVFEWDEAKSEANLRRRGFDFAHAAGIFDGPTLEMDDDRADYGERRIQAIGRVNKDVLFVVYTRRGPARRIVSARMASKRERDVYRKIFG